MKPRNCSSSCAAVGSASHWSGGAPAAAMSENIVEPAC